MNIVVQSGSAESKVRYGVNAHSVSAKIKVRYEYCRSERLGRDEGKAWVSVNSVSAKLK
jgi:hypothetical protein